MPTVLVIEDEDGLRRLFRSVLEEAGYRVQEAADGAEGLRLYSEAPVDLVITDIYMPGRDGLEVLQTQRRQYPKLKILVITGRTDIADFLEIAHMLGASASLRKPFEMGVFLQTVAGLLSESTSNPTSPGSKS
jgi:CheY-like chemotaxis protein